MMYIVFQANDFTVSREIICLKKLMLGIDDDSSF